LVCKKSLLFSFGLSSHVQNRDLLIDMLRVLAIFLVFVFHLPKVENHLIFGPWVRFGWMGVDLFFVISGYLIGGQILRSLQSSRFSFLWFYANRLLRTLPVYLIVLISYVFISDFREVDELPPILKFSTFTQNFGLSESAFSHAWSLCIEEQFYLFCPLVVVFFWKKKNRQATNFF
jgi:peptidoglycan/LPS O-acetylase OafA/YrhL